MAANRTSFEKLQRDRAKKARADAKREKRMARKSGTPLPDDFGTTDPVVEEIDLSGEGEIPADELLRMVEVLHKQYEDEAITFDEFEEKKIELMGRIRVD